MRIVNDFGGRYEATQVKVRMIKTLIVNVCLDCSNPGLSYAAELSEEELEQIAHEDWLEAQAAILKMAQERFPYIDMEFFADEIELEVVE